MKPIEVGNQLKVFEVINTWYTKVNKSMSSQSMNLDMEVQFNRSWLNMRLQRISLKTCQSQNHKSQDELPLKVCIQYLNHQLNVCTLFMTTIGNLPYSLCSWYTNETHTSCSLCTMKGNFVQLFTHLLNHVGCSWVRIGTINPPYITLGNAKHANNLAKAMELVQL